MRQNILRTIEGTVTRGNSSSEVELPLASDETWPWRQSLHPPGQWRGGKLSTVLEALKFTLQGPQEQI